MRSCALLLFLTFVKIHAWSVQTNVDNITPYKTRNVQLVCQQGDVPESGKGVQTVNGIRITKLDSFGDKNVFAEIHVLAKKPSSVEKDVEVTASIKQGEAAFLNVTWPVANDKTEGSYGCEITGYDALDNHVTIHARPSVKINRKTLTESDVVNLIRKMTQNYEKKQKELEMEIGSLRKYINENLKSSRQLIAQKDDEIKSKLTYIQTTVESTFATKTDLKQEVSELKNFTVNRILTDKSQYQDKLDKLSSLVHEASSNFEERFSKTTQNLSDFKVQLKSSVESLTQKDTDVLSHLNFTAKDLSRQIHSVNTKYERFLMNLTSDLAKKISDLQQECACTTTLPAPTTPKPKPKPVQSSNYWPEGDYALAKPETGCPFDATGRFLYKILSYFLSRRRTTKTVAVPEGVKFFISSDSKNTELQFCVKDSSLLSLSSTPWPNGTYCIAQLQGSSCPREFTHTYTIYYIQSLVTLAFVESYRMEQCCRSDQDPKVPIKLPKDVPFYLESYKGSCQQVEGMTATAHRLTLDAGRNTKVWTRRQDGDKLSSRQWIDQNMCHYQPA